MNTDQAYDLLMEAGVPEESGIQTVRRWLRERKITYETSGQKMAGYILEDTDQAFNLLKDAGVEESVCLTIVRRLLAEGKIQHVGHGDLINDSPSETVSRRILKQHSDQDKIIHLLKVKIEAQDEHIKGIEKLHKSSVAMLIQQREKLNKEIAGLKREKSDLEQEMKKQMEENIGLRNELLKLKEELSKGGKREPEKPRTSPPVLKTNDYRQKLGLSKTAGPKEVLAGYKRLLKITHPDHGGNPIAFHYIKSDYDSFRNNLKG